MKYLFILNPISGIKKKPLRIVDFVDSTFKTSGHKYEFVFTTHAGEASEIANKAVINNFDIVVAAGGDGTINEVASSIVNTDTVLGIIPLGSGNGIARSYNIPLEIKKSIQFLMDPKVVQVDVGQVDENYFLGVCGMGYDAVVGKHFQDFGIRGPIPYFLIGVREFIRYKPEKLKLEFNKKKLSISPLLMTISNTEQYGNGAFISPGSNPRDGELEICIINPMSVLKAIKSSLKLFNKKIIHINEYQMYKTSSVKIFADENGVYHTDGEPHHRQTETQIRVLPGALKVCAGLN